MHRLAGLVILAIASAPSPVCSDDRLPVLEFFGRPTGGFCASAGPALKTLQSELEGQAVLLEYDYDAFSGSEILDRFWATGSQANVLPLVMVGSGHLTTNGPESSYYNTYADLIAVEGGRPPRAEITAWWWRNGDTVQCAATVGNPSDAPLSTAHQARLWLVVFERFPIGVSNTWVRSATSTALWDDLEPGGELTVEATAVNVHMGSWERAEILVLVEDRPGGSAGPFDMAQAAFARPAALESAPEDVLLSAAATTAEITLDGPPVLEWSATSNVPWIDLEPSSGMLPASVTVTYRPELRPAGERQTTISVRAAGDTLVFESTIGVAIGSAARRSGRRVTP